MGFSTAYALATDPHMSLDTAVSIHFQSNCYPPIPQFMVPVACTAIVEASAGNWDTLIELPEGVETRHGRREVPASEIIDNCRLDAFIMEDYEGDC
jgi:hypothetical protein